MNTDTLSYKLLAKIYIQIYYIKYISLCEFKLLTYHFNSDQLQLNISSIVASLIFIFIFYFLSIYSRLYIPESMVILLHAQFYLCESAHEKCYNQNGLILLKINRGLFAKCSFAFFFFSLSTFDSPTLLNYLRVYN